MSDGGTSRYAVNVLGSDDLHRRQPKILKVDQQTDGAF